MVILKRKSNFTENLKTRYFQALSRSTSHQSLLGMICGILSAEICERKKKKKKQTNKRVTVWTTRKMSRCVATTCLFFRSEFFKAWIMYYSWIMMLEFKGKIHPQTKKKKSLSSEGKYQTYILKKSTISSADRYPSLALLTARFFLLRFWMSFAPSKFLLSPGSIFNNRSK